MTNGGRRLKDVNNYWQRLWASMSAGAGCGWAWPLMVAAREGNTTDAAVNEAMVPHFAPADEAALHVPAMLKAWITENASSLAHCGARRGDLLLWFLTWHCNRQATNKHLAITLVYIFSRSAKRVL